MSEAEGVVVSSEEAQYIIERQRYDIDSWQRHQEGFIVSLLGRIGHEIERMPRMTIQSWRMLEDGAAVLAEAARTRREKAEADER